MNAQPHLNTQYAWYDPRRYDLTISERIQNALAPNTAYANESHGSDLLGEGARTPVAENSVRNISGNPQREWSVVNSDGSRTTTGMGQTGYNAAQTLSKSTGGGGGMDGGNGGGGGGSSTTNVSNPVQDTFGNLLSRARGAARSTAEAGYNRARGIFDEGMGLLGKRKEEFQKAYETGNEDILNSYEKGRGELQASNIGAESRLANTMRALGLGGSAFMKGTGTQRQAAAKGLGQLNTEKASNIEANLGQFNENQNWANTQQNALQRALEDASTARNAAESSADIGYLQDMGNLFNTILSNQLAVNAAAGSKVANPYTVNMSDMTNALNSTLPILSGGAGTAVQNVSLEDQNPTLALLKKRSGVSGAGLYA